MLFNMKCPSCGATMQFDDTKDSMFCPYCGGKVSNVAEQVNINQQVNVSGTVIHVQDRSNDPNLYISYNTNNPAVGMVSRIVTTGVKGTYVNGQTQSFHLNQGPHTIVLKIGKRNYNRNIVIPPDNQPVRIYASFNGHAQISIDQPNVAPSVGAGNGQATPIQPSTPQPVGKPKAPLSILAFVLSLTVYLSWAGAGLGAVETFVLDKEKEKNHIFSYLAMGIGAFLTFFLLVGLIGGGSKAQDTGSTSSSVVTTISAEESQSATGASSNQSDDKTETTSETTTEATTTTEAPTEINPDIPLGTTYELGQGNYEVGDDIPAGRYRIEWIDGNQFGGYMTGAEGKYVDSSIVIDPDESYTCILEDGMTFSISLVTVKFTKISSLPNTDYLKDDGTYVLGSGYFFEGIDIPCGKYDLTAISGNQFGISVSTTNKKYISLDINETYSNLKLDHEGDKIVIALGSVRFNPK